jgi:hypothetical protein
MTTVFHKPSITIQCEFALSLNVLGLDNVEHLTNTTIKIPFREIQKDEEKDFIIYLQTSKDLSSPNDVNIQFSGNDIKNGNQTGIVIHPELGDDSKRVEYISQLVRIDTFTYLFAALDTRSNAKQIITDGINKIVQYPIHPSDYTNSIVNELNEYIALIDSNNASVWKKIIQGAFAHKHQRSVADDTVSHQKYNTKGQIAMQNRFVNREMYAVCHNCGEKGHFAKNCNLDSLCHVCFQPGHLQNACPQTQCYACKQFGHTSTNCPSSVGGEVCFGCGQAGHKKRDCPQGGGGGKKRDGERGGKRGGKRGGRRGKRNH